MNKRRRRINAIAKEDGVTPEDVEAGIAEVEGLLSMIAADSEIPDDALPRITTCPLCGGVVAFRPLSMLAIPMPEWTPDTTWGVCRSELKAYVLSYYEKTAKERGEQLSEFHRAFLSMSYSPYAVMLQCQQCGKGFDPRRQDAREHAKGRR